MLDKQNLNVLVCALANTNRCPRANRIIQLLKTKHQVSYLGFGSEIKGIQSYLLRKRQSFLVRALRLLFRVLRLHSLSERLSYAFPSKAPLREFDLIICHDIQLLPYLFKTGFRGKLIFDAREYYPRHFEQNPIWRFLHAPFQTHLCRKYLPQVSKGMTVSEGIREEYKKQFNVDFSVIYSLSPLHEIEPLSCGETINLVHHGGANPERRIEDMIEAMDYVEVNAELDLILVDNTPHYEVLKRMCEKRKNVNLLPPIDFEKIIPELNRYDLGLIFYPNSSFNLDNCMPNKLFEYVQARLGVICAPLNSLRTFLDKERNGLVTEDFTVQSLAMAINSLTPEIVNDFKRRAHELAQEYNQDQNNKKIEQMISELFPEPASVSSKKDN